MIGLVVDMGEKMTEFEHWFINQDFYTNMRFIHGDNLFSKDGDVYRVLPVQMTYVAFSEKHAEYAEAKQVGIALNTETINQRRYIGSQQAKIEQLEKGNARLAEMNKRYLGKMQEQQDMIANAKNIIENHRRYIPQSTVDALEKTLRGECE